MQVRGKTRPEVSSRPIYPLVLAWLLAFSVIAYEQVIHTTLPGLAARPIYETLHWLSDSLLAFPLAVAAVWGGNWLATRFRFSNSTPRGIAVHSVFIGLVFAALLVPGAVLHDEVDSLTHAHVALPSHAHGLVQTQGVSGPVAFVGHALADGIAGQGIGIPAVFLALWCSAFGRQQNATATEADEPLTAERRINDS